MIRIGPVRAAWRPRSPTGCASAFHVRHVRASRSVDHVCYARAMAREIDGSPGGDEGEGDRLEAFFRALDEKARREYAKLAELDRIFGEDVIAERRARTGQEP